MKNKSSFNYNSVFKILSKGRVSLVVCGMLATSGAWAVADIYPVHGVVASGSATIAGTSAMTVTQTTQKAIINWDSFSVSSGNSVAFNGGNVTLNRVSASGGLSTIAGTVTSDHALFFVNPNGITVSGTMTAPTLVLSTLNITDSDFNNENYKFTRGSATGSITNSGTIGDGGIATTFGIAALFAANVSNTGTITANNVSVNAVDEINLGLASGNAYNPVAATVPTSISNSGTIAAYENGNGGGRMDIYSSNGTITNDGGAIRSTSISGESGVDVYASGDIVNSGTIESTASGSDTASYVNVYSDTGMIDNEGGTIRSYSSSGYSNMVDVMARGNIYNGNGQIYSMTYYMGFDSVDVSVTSTAGSIDNSGGRIYSHSYDGSSGAVNVSARGDINNNHGYIYSQGINSGDVSVTSDTGYINNTSGQILSQGNGSSGSITLNAGGDIINAGGTIKAIANGSVGMSGSVSLTSGASIDNSNGLIASRSDSGSSYGVSVRASGSINNAGGEIYNYGGGYYAGDISVISENGSINNAGGDIHSIAYGNGFYSGAMNVKAFGNINNSGGYIYSRANGANGYVHIGVSVLSTDGAIDNTNGSIWNLAESGYNGQLLVSARGDVTNFGGLIYSRGKYGGNIGDGQNVYVSSIDGKIDLRDGSIFSEGARATDVYLTAPSIVYNNNSYVASLSSGSAVNGYGSTLYGEGTIRIKTNNLNTVTLTDTTATLASLAAASNTTYHTGSSVWNAKAGKMTLSDLKSLVYGASVGSVDYDQTTHSLSNAYGPAIFNSGDLSLSCLVVGRDYKFTENGSDVTGIRNAGTHNIGITMLNSNYGLSNPTATSAFTVNKKSISLAEGSTFTADNKVYNGTTATTAHASFDGVYNGDIVTAAGAFDTKEVGTGKTVTLVLAGADGGNYTTDTRIQNMNNYQWVTTVVNHTTTANITAAPGQIQQSRAAETIKAAVIKAQKVSEAANVNINHGTLISRESLKDNTPDKSSSASNQFASYGASSTPKANNAQGFMVGRDITGGKNAMAYTTTIPGIFVLN